MQIEPIELAGRWHLQTSKTNRAGKTVTYIWNGDFWSKLDNFANGFVTKEAVAEHLETLPSDERSKLDTARFADEEYGDHGDLKRLFDYTKFHVGLYSTVVAAVLTYIRYKKGVTGIEALCLWVGVLAILVAGLAGGVILGNLSHFRSYEGFVTSNLKWGAAIRRILPFEFKYDKWASIEHTAFWIGVSLIVITLACFTYGHLEVPRE